MSILHKLKVNALESNAAYHQILLDGVPVHCRGFDLHMEVGEIPSATLEVVSMPEVNELADVRIAYHPASVSEAHAIMRGAILSDPELREAWLSTITDAITEYVEGPDEDVIIDVLAEKVLTSIIGEVK